MNNTNTASLANRRASLSERFASFRLAALAASAVASHAETMPRPIAPRMPSIWVAKRAPIAPVDPLDAPLPADFTPAPFVPYVSEIVTLDAETEAEIARESAAEIAEVFARIDAEIKAEDAKRQAAILAAPAPASVAEVAPYVAPQAELRAMLPALPVVHKTIPNVVTEIAPVSEFEALRLAVLAL